VFVASKKKGDINVIANFKARTEYQQCNETVIALLAE
jgi:hypothetical protein